MKWNYNKSSVWLAISEQNLLISFVFSSFLISNINWRALVCASLAIFNFCHAWSKNICLIMMEYHRRKGQSKKENKKKIKMCIIFMSRIIISVCSNVVWSTVRVLGIYFHAPIVSAQTSSLSHYSWMKRAFFCDGENNSAHRQIRCLFSIYSTSSSCCYEMKNEHSIQFLLQYEEEYIIEDNEMLKSLARAR